MAKVKNWSKFQHYKNRLPPWVKLHRDLLDDRKFACLPLASKALAPMVWLVASEADGGEFLANPEDLAFRLRWPIEEVVAGLKPLIEQGFIEDASKALAECLQLATPETETETETEKAPQSPPSAAVDFRADLFARWKALPDGGGGAFLNKLLRDHKPEQRVLEAVERTLDEARADPKAFVLGVLRKASADEDAYDDLMARALR